MRASITALLVAVIVAGCAGGRHSGARSSETRAAAAAPLKAPVLPTTASPRSVARFPCKRGGTTVELESCSVRRVLALNSRLNRLIKLTWRRLGDDTGRRYFVTAARAWEAYVRNECTSRSRGWINPKVPHSYVGGTLAPVLDGACQVELTRARLRELAKTAATLAPH